jgi:hypothetical protein
MCVCACVSVFSLFSSSRGVYAWMLTQACGDYGSQCPSCKAPVQKRSGCNKMACVNGTCHVYFCFSTHTLPHSCTHSHSRTPTHSLAHVLTHSRIRFAPSGGPVCGKLLNKERPYDHFQEPSSSCFNRLMDRVRAATAHARWYHPSDSHTHTHT